ncbi:CDP-diacylglycerol--glycerol-3-phosphate 3-phosphatidyltransferase [Candidatus Saccharibacteria bacterium]|nr:CDP-diacylglycerol--glycerol-3-phosphate 3-phosphatidyltransferase [Candidatus Saccharibacteria bacterium]
MNLPNKLTVFRVVLVAPFVALLLLNFKWIALAIFILASITDFLDGYLARSRNEITDFGKFMDPLADKLLVISALICFVEMLKIPAWFVIIIISRDFIVSGIRMLAAEQGRTIAASYFGKIKTFVQMVMIIAMLLDLPFDWYQTWVIGSLFWLTLLATIASGADYVWENRSVLKDM